MTSFDANIELAVHLLVVLLLITEVTSEPCPSFCRFRFCARLQRTGNVQNSEDRVFVLRPPNAPQGPFPCIIRRRGFLKGLNNATAGEARVAKEFSGDRFIRISKYMQLDIKPSFPKDYFRFIEFPQTRKSTLTRRRSRGNQEEALSKLCVQLPIKSYRRLSKNGAAGEKVIPKERRACVGFRIRLAILDIDFRWNSTNDFDLRLQEPNGNIISRFGGQDRSPNGGRLIRDIGERTCEIVFGQERIIYTLSSKPEEGEYKIIVDHTRVCSPSSEYSLLVSHEGEVIVNENGIITDVGEEVLTRKFTILS